MDEVCQNLSDEGFHSIENSRFMIRKPAKRFDELKQFEDRLYGEVGGLSINGKEKKDRLTEECDLWQGSFTFLRIIGTAIIPSSVSRCPEDIKASLDHQEEIFAEHHDVEKLESMTSADNLINAIAYHTQGNDANTGEEEFWGSGSEESDETETSVNVVGKTFRIDTAQGQNSNSDDEDQQGTNSDNDEKILTEQKSSSETTPTNNDDETVSETEVSYEDSISDVCKLSLHGASRKEGSRKHFVAPFVKSERRSYVEDKGRFVPNCNSRQSLRNISPVHQPSAKKPGQCDNNTTNNSTFNRNKTNANNKLKLNATFSNRNLNNAEPRRKTSFQNIGRENILLKNEINITLASPPDGGNYLELTKKNQNLPRQESQSRVAHQKNNANIQSKKNVTSNQGSNTQQNLSRCNTNTTMRSKSNVSSNDHNHSQRVRTSSQQLNNANIPIIHSQNNMTLRNNVSTTNEMNPRRKSDKSVKNNATVPINELNMMLQCQKLSVPTDSSHKNKETYHTNNQCNKEIPSKNIEVAPHKNVTPRVHKHTMPITKHVPSQTDLSYDHDLLSQQNISNYRATHNISQSNMQSNQQLSQNSPRHSRTQNHDLVTNHEGHNHNKASVLQSNISVHRPNNSSTTYEGTSHTQSNNQCDTRTHNDNGTSPRHHNRSSNNQDNIGVHIRTSPRHKTSTHNTNSNQSTPHTHNHHRQNKSTTNDDILLTEPPFITAHMQHITLQNKQSTPKYLSSTSTHSDTNHSRRHAINSNAEHIQLQNHIMKPTYLPNCHNSYSNTNSSRNNQSRVVSTTTRMNERLKESAALTIKQVTRTKAVAPKRLNTTILTNLTTRNGYICPRKITVPENRKDRHLTPLPRVMKAGLHDSQHCNVSRVRLNSERQIDTENLVVWNLNHYSKVPPIRSNKR